MRCRERSNLARTSNTPGRTQELNYFDVGAANMPEERSALVHFVDMPGYGYAEAPRDMVSAVALPHQRLSARARRC